MHVDINELQKHHIDVAQVLGGKATFRQHMPSSPLEWAERISNKGLPYKALVSFVESAGIDNVTAVLSLHKKTIRRRESTGSLSYTESNTLYEHARIFAEAANVLGSVEKARRWISSPIKALGNKAPLMVMKTAPGADEVLNVLMRIEHGGYS